MGAIWCAPGCGRGHEAPVHQNDTVAAWTPIFWACWHLAASRREARRLQPWGFKTCCKLGNPCAVESRRCWKPRPMPIKTSTGIGCTRLMQNFMALETQVVRRTLSDDPLSCVCSCTLCGAYTLANEVGWHEWRKSNKGGYYHPRCYTRVTAHDAQWF